MTTEDVTGRSEALFAIGSGNVLLPVRHQPIVWNSLTYYQLSNVGGWWCLDDNKLIFFMLEWQAIQRNIFTEF